MADKPELILIMGVAASGKTTLARRVAELLQLRLLDADDFHSSDARHMMASGIALNDAIRDAWAQRILESLTTEANAGNNCVLAFSGLRQRHRQIVCSVPMQVRSYLLHGDADTLGKRIAARKNHFMPASLLQDQLATLEPPAADETITLLDIEQSVDELAAVITGFSAGDD